MALEAIKATIKLTLPNPINVSLQSKATTVASGGSDSTCNIDAGAWDIIYFVRTEDTYDCYDNTISKPVGKIFKLGKCIAVTPGVDNYEVTVELPSTLYDSGFIEEPVQTPENGDYIFFGKDNKVGTSGVVGYFTEVEMKNDSQTNAELFAVSSEITKSSK